MKKYFIVLIALSFVFFAGCKTSVNNPQVVEENEESKPYPMLKVENKKTTGNFIFLIELPNYKISPLEIRGGESMTFELCNGMLSYKNVTVMIQYGLGRNYQNYYYERVNFENGKTTVITLK